ncbi:MAG: histone [Nanoarchaeota archaeon]|nr:histone [Nanoarchaeota archaeon]
MAIIPSAAMERVLRNSGAKRVSDSAKKAFAEILEKRGIAIGEQAIKIARNCGRKTVLDSDIKMVRL